MPEPAPRNILIIRPSAIGDIAMASAMLPPLRDGYPGAQVAWLIEPHLKEVLEANPLVDRLIVWPKAEWRRLGRENHWLGLAREVNRFKKSLRKERFDLALDAQGLLRSRLLAWLSGATVRIGFDSKEPGRSLLTRTISRGESIKMMSSEYRHMIVELGLDPGSFRQCLTVADRHRQEARDALGALGLGQDYAVVAPFTTRPQKHWFDERWSALGRDLSQQFHWPVVILGGPGDAERAEAICQAAEGAMVHLAGELSLGASMGVLQKARLLVGVDTGLTHMGPAFERPTVALFGATCPYLETGQENTRVLYHRRECSPCKRNPTCDGRFDCMVDITVEEVIETARELLRSTG